MPDTSLYELLIDMAPHCSVCGALATRRYADLGSDIDVFIIRMGELSKLAWTPNRTLTVGEISRRTLAWVQRESAELGEEIPNLEITDIQPWSLSQGPFFCDEHTGVYESLNYRDLLIAPMVRRVRGGVVNQSRLTRFQRILEEDDTL